MSVNTRTGRNVELFLLIIAVALVLGAYCLTGWTATGELPAELTFVASIFIAIALILHIILRFMAPYADPVILPIVLAINGLGITMIYRIDLAWFDRGVEVNNGSKQTLWLLVGAIAAAALILLIRDHRWLRRYTYVFMTLSILLVFLPFVPGLGTERFGARIWISIFGYSLQP